MAAPTAPAFIDSVKLLPLDMDAPNPEPKPPKPNSTAPIMAPPIFPLFYDLKNRPESLVIFKL